MWATAGGLQKPQIRQHRFAQAVEEIVALSRVELASRCRRDVRRNSGRRRSTEPH
jgi:hypothetical protein